MKTPENNLSITAEAVQTFAPFDFVAAQTRFKSSGGGATLQSTTANRPTASRSPAPQYGSQSPAVAILHEALTFATIAGLMAFQYEIIRCFW